MTVRSTRPSRLAALRELGAAEVAAAPEQLAAGGLRGRIVLTP